MRKPALAATSALALALALAGCAGGADTETQASSAPAQTQSQAQSTPQSTAATSARAGSFAGLNDKTVAGTVEVTDTEITLAGFSSDEGPDLHVYLTNGTDEAAVAAGVEIDVVSFDTASQTFSLSGVDAADYDTVVIHCDKANAVFGAAELS